MVLDQVKRNARAYAYLDLIEARQRDRDDRKQVTSFGIAAGIGVMVFIFTIAQHVLNR